MELAQRRVYGGAKGPHLNLQSVILVAPDGGSAWVRARVLQMMASPGARRA